LTWWLAVPSSAGLHSRCPAQCYHKLAENGVI
jgi:hypothetical protein